MAAKTKSDEATVNEVVEKAEVNESAEKAEVVDPKANWPTIFIPKRDKEDTQRLFSINFKEYIVQTGKQVKVPPELYEVYHNSIAAEAARDEYEEEQLV